MFTGTLYECSYRNRERSALYSFVFYDITCQINVASLRDLGTSFVIKCVCTGGT